MNGPAASALALGALLSAGCIPDPGPMMAPGRDCMECHGGGGGGEEDAVAWTVAGTVTGSMSGQQGSKVSIRDATGWSFTLTANQAGNFYTRETVRFPLIVAVDGHVMPNAVQAGDASCNRCHGSGGDGGGGGG
jgi:mono/diheme cytochrome c family protein